MQCSECFRRDFREYQYHQRKNAGGDRDGRLAADAQRDDGRDRRCQHIDEVVTEQNQPDQAVGPFQQLLCPPGTGVIRLGKVAQAVPVEGHQPGFGTGEERRQDDQKDQRTKQNTKGNILQ